MLQHPAETPELSYQPHLHFSSSERAAGNAQPMNSVHVCAFSIFSIGGGQQVFSISEELKMYFILLSPLLAPVSSSHFCYQI